MMSFHQSTMSEARRDNQSWQPGEAKPCNFTLWAPEQTQELFPCTQANPANPATSCWCSGWVLAGQSVLLKGLQVMMNSPFPPHNQGIAWFASGSYFTRVPKMYYTNWPGFRPCITDISIWRKRLCQHLQEKLLFLQTSVLSAWDRSHPRKGWWRWHVPMLP